MADLSDRSPNSEATSVHVEKGSAVVVHTNTGTITTTNNFQLDKTFAWRPKAGEKIPGNEGWELLRPLCPGGFGEVWLVEEGRRNIRHAFKFCFDERKLKSMERELAIADALNKQLPNRDDIGRIENVHLDAPPYYFSTLYAEDGALDEWAEGQGGLAKVSEAQRLRLFSLTASAVAVAHKAGVVHRDIKPQNILIIRDANGWSKKQLCWTHDYRMR